MRFKFCQIVLIPNMSIEQLMMFFYTTLYEICSKAHKHLQSKQNPFYIKFCIHEIC